MNRKIKNLIAGFTTLSMCFSMISVPNISADDGLVESPTTSRNLYVEFMGKGNKPSDVGRSSASLNDKKDEVGDEFWIGVAVDNVNDLDLFKNGIYSLELAFEYDPKYIVPYRETTYPDADWKSAIVNGNMADGNDSLWWDRSKYDVISERQTDINLNPKREDLDLAKTRADKGWKMCTVNVTLKDDSDFSKARFYNLAESEKQYLIKLPFKIVSFPASDAADSNPIVLSLIRGPETLNISSGQNANTYSEWEKDTPDMNDATNMHTLFKFNGDIGLYGEGALIEDIVPVSTATDDAGTSTETEHAISVTKDLQQEGFSSEVVDYYVSVPNEVEKLKLKVTSQDGAITSLTANGDNVTYNYADGVYTTDEFSLIELNKDVDSGGEVDGYNNSVVITDSGGNTYTIHIRRLLEPKIVLNYGNSPAGLIMRDDVTFPTLSDKEDAIQAFDDSHEVNKKYADGKVPIDGEKDMVYTIAAWNSYKDENNQIINYDLNKYALFVYQGNTFNDPGYTIYDENGDVIEADANVTATVKRQKTVGVSEYKNDDGVIDYDIPLVGSTKSTYSLLSTMVRMDVYSMEYSYNIVHNNGQVTTLEASRPLIVLSKRGDIYLNGTPTINDGDSDALSIYTQQINSGNSIVAYRCADFILNATPTINDGDVDYLKDNLQAINGSRQQYYKNI